MSGIVGQNLGRGSGLVKATAVVADSVSGASIVDDAIDSEHYADASIDNAHLADNAVDTAEIADNAITLAKMAGGTDGNIISFDASGDPVAIATGDDGQVLTSTGAGSPPAFETLSAGGLLTKISSTTLSGAAVAQNGVFSSTYRNYFVTFENINVDTSTADVRFKYYQVSGATDDSKAGGGLHGYRHDESVISTSWANSNDAVLASNVYNTPGINGHCWVFNPISTSYGSSQMVWQVSYRHGTTSFVGGASGYNVMLSSLSHTGFYWHMSSGDFDGGIVTVYGITDPT